MKWNLMEDYYPPEDKKILFYNQSKDRLYVGLCSKPMILARFIGLQRRVYWEDGQVDSIDNLCRGRWWWSEIDFDLPGEI